MRTFPKIAKNYGPGKFEGQTELEAAVWEMSLDGGPDEEAGDVESIGWYGIVRFSPEERAELAQVNDEAGHPYFPGFGSEERRAPVGAILYEDSQGFAEVSFYYDEEQLAAYWKDVQKQDAEFHAEAE